MPFVFLVLLGALVVVAMYLPVRRPLGRRDRRTFCELSAAGRNRLSNPVAREGCQTFVAALIREG